MRMPSRIRPSLRLLAGIALVALAAPASLGAQLHAAHAAYNNYLTITTKVDDAGADCSSSSSGCSLRGAVALADSNSTQSYSIYVPSGRYPVFLGPLAITSSAAIAFNGASQTQVMIDGDCDNTVFALSNANVSMRNLTIERGCTTNNGGGIQQNEGTLSLTSVTLYQNLARGTVGHGGGLFLAPTGQDTLTAVTLEDNSAVDGAAIYSAGGSYQITGGVIKNNRACNGSLDFGETSPPTLSCEEIGNVPNGDSYLGGGIYNGGAMNITSATISGNSAGTDYYGNGYGGGIENFGLLSVNKSTISNNEAFYESGSGHGGGVENGQGSQGAEIDNTTISGNFAGALGGGIYNAAPLGTSNDRIINNQAGGCPAGDDCEYAFDYGGGGGIYDSAAALTDQYSYISGNQALDSSNGYQDDSCQTTGGGILLSDTGTATLTGAHLISNHAACGGGTYQTAGTVAPQLTFNNSYLYQNLAGYLGGGMYLLSFSCGTDDLALYNTRVVNNSADTGGFTLTLEGGAGGGLYTTDGDSYQASGYTTIVSNHPDNVARSAAICVT